MTFLPVTAQYNPPQNRPDATFVLQCHGCRADLRISVIGDLTIIQGRVLTSHQNGTIITCSDACTESCQHYLNSPED